MHGRFFPRWVDAVRKLEPAPERVIVATHSPWDFDGVDLLRVACTWTHPQAFYMQRAIELADGCEWVWPLDIDDIPLADALLELEFDDADVLQLGFIRSDGVSYVPPELENDDYLASWTNPYVGASLLRRDAFLRVGGYADVAFQDWAIWRRLAASGARFRSTGRTHFHYMQHPYTRTATELGIELRAAHIDEMIGAEVAAV